MVHGMDLAASPAAGAGGGKADVDESKTFPQKHCDSDGGFHHPAAHWSGLWGVPLPADWRRGHGTLPAGLFGLQFRLHSGDVGNLSVGDKARSRGNRPGLLRRCQRRHAQMYDLRRHRQHGGGVGPLWVFGPHRDKALRRPANRLVPADSRLRPALHGVFFEPAGLLFRHPQRCKIHLQPDS